jgi:hypothetical protein
MSPPFAVALAKADGGERVLKGAPNNPGQHATKLTFPNLLGKYREAGMGASSQKTPATENSP